ncbi:hypothetical protein QCE96_08020 [Staphylococcus aureus]|uniref:hypothetical protein n=1 Tax=Mammaliicoccus sciuri TaxID=1296 RepID=UPI0039DFD0FB|nr:hypothetical protein [Staphylococcus aureus]
MIEFEYKGYNFKMNEWSLSDFSDETKGYVQAETNLGWVDIIEYHSFEDNSTLTLLDENNYTERYYEDDNFYFDEEHVTSFISGNEYSVMELIKEEQAV